MQQEAAAVGHGAGPVRAVLLDALGTLVELQPPGPRLVRELSARLDVAVTAAQADRAIAAEIEYYRGHFDEGRDEASLAALRRRCAQVVAESLSLSAELDLTEALLASIQFRLYPDVRPVLEPWRRRGVSLVVVSNWDISLRSVLDRLGISDLLSAVITSAEVGARKPAGEMFRRGLAAAGVGAGQAVHVGDGLEEDVAGAQAAGIPAVWLQRHGRRPAPPGVHAVASLRELADIV